MLENLLKGYACNGIERVVSCCPIEWANLSRAGVGQAREGPGCPARSTTKHLTATHPSSRPHSKYLRASQVTRLPVRPKRGRGARRVRAF